METLQGKSIEEVREEMAALLGLDAPVDEQVAHAALHDPTYAQHLLVCRGDPEFLSHLLADPPRARPQPSIPAKSTATLARNAAESLVRWGKTGFSTVSEQVYQRRMDACHVCPHLRTPPEHQRRLYALAGANPVQPSVCDYCGCIVSTKAQRPGDTCPAPDEARPGLNRWSEPIVAKL